MCSSDLDEEWPDRRRIAQRVQHQGDGADELAAEGDRCDVLTIEAIGDTATHEDEDGDRQEFCESQPADVELATRDVIHVLAERCGLQHHPDVEGETASEKPAHRGRAKYLAGTKLLGGTRVTHRLSTLIEWSVRNEEGV